MSTQTDYLVTAAHELPPLFSVADLSVMAWKLFPRVFGLDGYQQQHPDHHRIMSALSATSGPMRRGLFRRVRPNIYELVPAGAPAAPAVPATGAPNGATPSACVPLLESAACAKWQAAAKQTITFADASQFWGLTPDLDLDNQLGIAQASIRDNPVRSERRLLLAVHEYMQERFARHLSLLRQREPRSEKAKL